MELRTERFSGKQVELEYAKSDSGTPTVLLIHGLGGRKEDWFAQPSCVPSGWRVLAVDLRGHGASGHAQNQYQFQDYVEDISEFVRRAVGEPTVLWGHSLGAVTAAGVAAQVPELVTAAILEDPPFFSPSRPDHAQFRERFRKLYELARSHVSFGELVERLQELNPNASPESIQESAERLSVVDPDIYARAMQGRAGERFDSEAALSAIQAPVLLLQGNSELGGVMTDEDGDRTMAALRHGQIVRFRDAGHAIHRTQPQATEHAIHEFLTTQGIVDGAREPV